MFFLYLLIAATIYYSVYYVIYTKIYKLSLPYKKQVLEVAQEQVAPQEGVEKIYMLKQVKKLPPIFYLKGVDGFIYKVILIQKTYKKGQIFADGRYIVTGYYESWTGKTTSITKYITVKYSGWKELIEEGTKNGVIYKLNKPSLEINTTKPIEDLNQIKDIIEEGKYIMIEYYYSVYGYTYSLYKIGKDAFRVPLLQLPLYKTFKNLEIYKVNAEIPDKIKEDFEFNERVMAKIESYTITSDSTFYALYNNYGHEVLLIVAKDKFKIQHEDSLELEPGTYLLAYHPH